MTPASDLVALFDLLRTAGAPGLLMVFVLGLKQEWWVMGGQHRQIVGELKRVTDLYQRSVEVTEKRVEWLLQLVLSMGGTRKDLPEKDGS